MVFNNAAFLTIFILAISVWVVILSVVVVRMIAHYNRLTQGVTAATLRDVMTHLLSKQDGAGKDIEEIKKTLAWVQKDGTLHLQKLGIVRFNPFSDTGGSQSFTLALLDGKDNGIVMTSLYARSGNRWYIKHIKQGTCEEMELSKEEQLAIKKSRPVG